MWSFENRVDLCSHIGAGVMVLHMQQPWKLFEESPQDKEDYFRQVYRSFDELEPMPARRGVRVALENLIVTPWQLQDETFERMFDRYPEDFLGFTFDSGHATLQCRQDHNYFLRKYYQRMYATHLQENASIPEELAGTTTRSWPTTATGCPWTRGGTAPWTGRRLQHGWPRRRWTCPPTLRWGFTGRTSRTRWNS